MGTDLPLPAKFQSRPTTNLFRKPVPEGTEESRAGTEVPGKETNRNRESPLGDGTTNPVRPQIFSGNQSRKASQEHWTVADLLFEDDVFTQPRHEFVEGELASFVERKHEILRPLGGGRELCAVDREKRIHGGESHALSLSMKEWFCANSPRVRRPARVRVGNTQAKASSAYYPV